MNYKKDKLSYPGVLCALLIIMIFGAAGCASRNITVSQPDKAMESASDPKLITGIISTTEDIGTVVVSVNSNKPLTYSSVKQPLPLSVILYFPETALEDFITGEIPENSIIRSVKASELQGAGHTSKIVISLIKDVSYEVKSENTGLRIVFAKPAKKASSPDITTTTPPVVSEENKPVNKQVVSLIDKGNPPLDPKYIVGKTANSDIAWINRIDFSSEDAGRSTIIVGTTKPIKYKIEKAGNKRLNLLLGKTEIPTYHNRPLITTRFVSAVDRITPVKTPGLKDTSLLSIELRESVPYFVEQTDNLLFIHFDASSIPPRPLEDADLPPWKKVLTQQTVASAEAEHKQIKKQVSSQVLSDQQKKNGDYVSERNEGINAEKVNDYYDRGKASKFTGEKIALDFYETDIKNVFRILKEISGKNFAIDKDVSGTVSLSFDNPVPWDQVLDIVLRMNQLDKVYEDDIIRIATFKTLRQEEAALKSKLKAKQESELQEDLVTVFLPVNYGDAEEIVKMIDLEGRGSISVDSRNNTIILTAAPVIIKRAKEIVQKVDKITPQVIIEARIVEVTDDFSRSIGVQWSASGDLNKVTGGDFLDYDFAFNHAVASSSAIGGTFQRVLGSNVLVDAQLTAEEANSNAKIISSPKVITLDNEKATIKQGTQHPYLERDDSGGSSVKFKDVDLLLEVTPHITFDMRIFLELKITKNDVTGYYGTELVPIISTKEVESLLILEDGATIVLGGVRQDTVNSGESATPWLSKIPVLGWLFKSKTNSSNKSELLIFITPTVVKL